MLGLLNERGYEITDDEAEADVCVINTCCFIGDAKVESINTILEMAKLKEGRLKSLIVTGCLAQRYKDEIRQDIPEVDEIIGTSAYDKIVEAIESSISNLRYEYMESLERLPVVKAKRMLSTIGNHYAYLKIAEGCEKNCTYCIIPKIRGKYRSVPMEELVAEARTLVEDGVRELILVAQETTLYGVDLYGRKSLHKLIAELSKIEELRWIRLLYCYPEEIYDELIDEMVNNEKFVHYLDLPIQHCSDRILRRMGRRTDKQSLKNTVSKLRSRVDDIILRTTLIAGFPGETDDDFEEMLDFVDEMEFDRLGVFPYSPEENTPAASFENQVDDEVKNYRRDQIMGLSGEIAVYKAESYVGREFDVIIEGYIDSENAYVGRTYMDAPGVDGYIFLTYASDVTDRRELMAGDFVRAKVIKTGDYDLVGEIIQ
jgi:ribosomal protein S12 methylthiotransferase